MRKNTRIPEPPEGFRYQEEILPQDEEQELVERIRELPLKEFEFRGYVGRSMRLKLFFGKSKRGKHTRTRPAFTFYIIEGHIEGCEKSTEIK